MSKKLLNRKRALARATRRVFDDEFKREAVQMLLDGHTASSVAQRLGLSGTNLHWPFSAGTNSRGLSCRGNDCPICRVARRRGVRRAGSQPVGLLRLAPARFVVARAA